MKRIVIFILISLVLLGLHLYIGTPITLFLSIVLIASLLYYITSMLNERSIDKELQVHNHDEIFLSFLSRFKEKRFAWMSTGLMVIVFLSSLYCLKKVINPTKSESWFLNIDHHALSNKAISFERNASFIVPVLDSNESEGGIQIQADETNYSIYTKDLFEPILQLDELGKTHLINKVFPSGAKKSISIKRAHYKIDIEFIDYTKRRWYKPWSPELFTNFTIKLQTIDDGSIDGLPNSWQDEFTFSRHALQKGIELTDLLEASNTKQTYKSETGLLLQQVFEDIGNCMLIVDHSSNARKIFFMPSETFLLGKHEIFTDKNLCIYKPKMAFQIEAGQSFYLGLQGYKSLMKLDTFQGRHALIFDFPQSYYLTNPTSLSAGKKCIRFITNQLSILMNNPSSNGFYFTSNLLQSNSAINGSLEFIADLTNHELAAQYLDINDKNPSAKKLVNNEFELQTSDESLKYHFSIRNFSNNRFGYNYLICYASFLFVLFSGLMLFKRGKKLERIEPIIWACVYALIMIRFILYWRIATFPPLESITKYELEKTLIGFDFSLFGFSLPFPVTLLFTFLIVVFIFCFRVGMFERFNFFEIAQNWFANNISIRFKKLHFIYIAFLFACLFLDAIVSVEFLKRILTILLPLMMYVFVCIRANHYYEPLHYKQTHESKVVQYFRAYLFYLYHNPTFILSMSTISFFAVADRGFCILFILFLLLKNILLNFYKKSFEVNKVSLFAMFVKPWHYWVYGVSCLLIYLVVLSFKSLFYYVLTYKFAVILIILFVINAILYFFYKANRKFLISSVILSLSILLLFIIPPSRNYLDAKITEQIKFVQHRASIIHQPISELLRNNSYSSFNTRKIVETAENQWFINSYITKDFDNSTPINLRKFSKVGVNYNTQTRDVVIARFVIGELGGLSMVLILGLFILPLFVYLLSFKLKKENQPAMLEDSSYGGLIPLLILFTSSLFVWLTSTNRFVFFGQDFPFLSLTSRLSVLMPLMLFAIVLIQKPIAYKSLKLNLGLGVSRYSFLVFIILLFGYTTIKQNELSKNNFSVVVKTTQDNIDMNFNAILGNIQDSLHQRKTKWSYDEFVKVVINHENYTSFKLSLIQDEYTKSIFENWEKNPSSAMQLNNPLYIRFTQGRYAAEYNKSLYLALPATDNKSIWHGSVVESTKDNDNQVYLNYKNSISTCELPYYDEDINTGVQLAVIPSSWLPDAMEPLGMVNVANQYRSKTSIIIQHPQEPNEKQNAVDKASYFSNQDNLLVSTKQGRFSVSFSQHNSSFASHKWVNGEYRTLYPMKERNFWIYNFVNTIRPFLKETPTQTIPITLDYTLYNKVQQRIQETYSKLKKRNLSFNVITADGDGNIRLMNDFIVNRRKIDPNNKSEIYNMQERHFFYSNTKNERDQWGNANLLNLHLGPGSSIKPLIVACMTSQVNAGWQYLNYVPQAYSDKTSYAGLKLSRPWKDDEHYSISNEVDMPFYLQESSNFYHSVIMFLGSYRRVDFGNDSMSLKNILTVKGNSQTFPILKFNQQVRYLPSYNNGEGKWPISSRKLSKSYFAEENSILARGLSINANLSTSDNDKLDGSPMNTRKTFFVDSALEARLTASNIDNAIWSVPEASSFAQRMRHFISDKSKNEINENFNLGLKTATLGGYPYQITPFKMLEMYNALFTFNRKYAMHIMPCHALHQDWYVDSSWTMMEYKKFLATNIFEGMKRVIVAGTAKELKILRTEFPDYNFYAKTGTINEEGGGQSSSRRLVVSVTDKPLTEYENIGESKVYSFYFVVDNTGDFNWDLVKDIIRLSLNASSCKNYFRTHEKK